MAFFKPNNGSKNFIAANFITVIDENGNNLGSMATGAAKAYAYEHGASLQKVEDKVDTYCLKPWESRFKNQSEEYKSNRNAQCMEQMQYEITASQVRLTDENGASLGIVDTSYAKQLADERGLDLIAVNNGTTPPIGKLGDLNKYIYEQKKRKKEMKKKQDAVKNATKEKCISFPSDTTASSKHDRDRLIAQANDFLAEGHSVRFNIRFSGRSVDHAMDVIERIKPEMVEGLTNGTMTDIDQNKRIVSICVVPVKRK